MRHILVASILVMVLFGGASALAQDAGGATWSQPERAAQDDAAAELVALDFQDTPIAEAAAALAKQLDTVIVVDPEVSGNLTIQRDVPVGMAPQALALSVQAVAQPALIFVPAEQVATPTKPSTLPKVSLNLTAKLQLGAAVEVLQRASGRQVRALPEVSTVEIVLPQGNDQALAAVLDDVATQAEAVWLQGWVYRPLQQADVIAGLQMVERIPAAQKQQFVAQGLETLLVEYTKLSPADRVTTVRRITQVVEQWVGRLAQQPAEVVARIRAVAEPLVPLVLGRIGRLPAADQAVIKPLLDALAQLR